MQVTFAKLEEAMNEHRQRLLDEAGIVTDSDDEEQHLVADDLIYYLSECSPKFEAFLKEQGLYVEDEVLHFDPTKFDAIQAMCQKIIDEYDSDGHELWEEFGLHGDDDVDYNGGYILIFLDALSIMFSVTTLLKVTVGGDLELPEALDVNKLLGEAWPADTTLGDFRRAVTKHLGLAEMFNREKVFVHVLSEETGEPYPDDLTLGDLRKMVEQGVRLHIVIDDKEGGAPARVPERVH